MLSVKCEEQRVYLPERWLNYIPVNDLATHVPRIEMQAPFYCVQIHVIVELISLFYCQIFSMPDHVDCHII